MKTKEFPEQALLSPMYGKQVTVKFDNLSFVTTLVTAESQKLTGMANPPEKRKNSDGKSYTPKCLRLVCEAGALVVVQEDYNLVAIRNGVAFMFADYALEIRHEG
jgi:hypothetical protein